MELEKDGVVTQQLVEYHRFDRDSPLTCTKSRSGRPLRRRTARHVLQERSRQKRQILQGMARPLKRWLVRHRGNPYPTKAEKVALALGSQMTLVQVSNWFANARRRLKNTVNTPDAGWAKRIKMYNSCVVGNAELLSISSDDSIWDSEDDEERNSNADHCYSAPEGSSLTHSLTQTTSRKAFVTSSTSYPDIPARQRKRCCDEEDSDVEESVHDLRPNKYKRTIMQRYLHDSRDRPVAGKEDSSRDPVRSSDTVQCVRLQKGGDSIGSFSDSDHSSTSRSLSVSSTHFKNDFSFSDDEIPYEEIQRRQNESSTSKESRYWKEFDAAIVLISLGHCASTPINSASSCN